MRSIWEGGRSIAGAASVVGLIAAGFVSALLFAGGALGQLQLPTTTVTTPSLPTTTVTTPSVPIVPTTTVTTPRLPTTTVTTPTPPRVTPPPPPPSPPPSPPPATPRVTPPPPAPPRVTPPPPPPPALPKVSPPSLPPPPVSLPKAPSAPKGTTPSAPSAPAIQAPPPPVGAPSLPTSPGAAPSGFPSSSPARRTGAATGASAGAAGPSSGAAQGGQGRTTTTAAAAGAAFGSGGFYRPSQEPYLLGLPSSNAAALDYGAFIVPTGGAARGLFALGRGALRAAEPNLLALLGLPDFMRLARAQAARREDGGLSALPDVQRVLGQQEVLSDLDGGGGLTFGQLPLVALGLVLVSSFLLVGAVLPPGVVARTPLSPASYARAREPLALAALGILVPVAVVALVVALS